MATKMENYVNEIKKFLFDNYETYIETESVKDSFVAKNTFVIKTKNQGYVRIALDLFTCSKPFKYDLFTRKNHYVMTDAENKILEWNKDLKENNKNNFLAIPTIADVKNIILSEYQSTVETEYVFLHEAGLTDAQKKKVLKFYNEVKKEFKDVADNQKALNGKLNFLSKKYSILNQCEEYTDIEYITGDDDIFSITVTIIPAHFDQQPREKIEVSETIDIVMNARKIIEQVDIKEL